MKRLELEQATAPLAQYARGVRHEPVILTTHGKPVAALFFIANIDWETVSLSTNPEFLELIEHSRRSLKEEGGLSEEEMRCRLNMPRKARKRTTR